jgi:Ca2+-binding RTX toxin-like protein
LRGGGGNDLLDGYSGGDKLIDLLGNNVFDAGRGNDRVEAGAGDDQFLFRAIDRVVDTVIGCGNGDDLVRLIGTSFADFEDVLAAGEDTAAGWRLQIDDETSVTFHGIIEAQLVAEDFAFVM